MGPKGGCRCASHVLTSRAACARSELTAQGEKAGLLRHHSARASAVGSERHKRPGLLSPWMGDALRPAPTGNASAGCALGRTLPQHWPTLVSGGTADVSLPTLTRPFRLSLPASYGAPASQPPPLLLHFHGWGGTLESGQNFHAQGVADGYLVASPLGFDDEGTQPTSWNGAGTAASPGPAGRSCYDPNGGFASMCYARSCGRCNDTWCAPRPRRALSGGVPIRTSLPHARSVFLRSLAEPPGGLLLGESQRAQHYPSKTRWLLRAIRACEGKPASV